MKKSLAGILMLSLSVSAAKNAVAQTEQTETITKGKYTLVFINKSPDFSSVTKQKMIDAFFEVYPKEAKEYNKQTLTKVTFIIDPAYDGVAATDDGVARYSPVWMKKNPEDVDVVTHEVMHIVQDYRHENPGWLTEGIADYVRYEDGVNNINANWKLPEYKASQSYTNAYRVTARFLVWVVENKNKHAVQKLDAALRAGTYTPELWTKLTGKSVDDLWKEYSANPTVSLSYK